MNGEPEMPLTQLMTALCWLPSGDSWWRVKKRLESNKRQAWFLAAKNLGSAECKHPDYASEGDCYMDIWKLGQGVTIRHWSWDAPMPAIIRICGG